MNLRKPSKRVKKMTLDWIFEQHLIQTDYGYTIGKADFTPFVSHLWMWARGLECNFIWACRKRGGKK